MPVAIRILIEMVQYGSCPKGRRIIPKGIPSGPTSACGLLVMTRGWEVLRAGERKVKKGARPSPT